MKKVYFYDQYSRVLDENGTLLHPSSGFTLVKGEQLDDNQANTLVEQLYNDSKTLGTYTDKLVKLNEGYAELVIEFPDKRRLTRCIYTK